MALWVCAGCTGRYAVGAPACPHCGSEDCYEQGDDDMAKITRHGGPSTALVRPGEGEFFQSAPDPAFAAEADTEGGEQSSPGTSSSPSDDSTPTTPETTETPSPSPARTTGSRSSRGRRGN